MIIKYIDVLLGVFSIAFNCQSSTPMYFSAYLAVRLDISWTRALVCAFAVVATYTSN